MIVHQPLSQDFTVIPNELLRDESLSMDAIAVACWLLSKPRDWRVNLTNLRRQFGRGHEKMQAIMRELIAAGWARREHKPGPRGTFGAGDYTVFNVRQPRQTDLDLDEAKNTAVGKPDSGDEGCATGVGFTGVGNPDSLLSIESKKNGSNPPYPPAGGARSDRDPESGERSAPRSRQPRSTSRPAEAGKGCRRAEPPAVQSDAAVLARFERLRKAYPKSGRLAADPREALARFVELTAAEQEAAIRTAVAYAASCAETRGQAKALHRWIRDGRWRNGDLDTPAIAAPGPGCLPERVFVREGSAEWEAWAAHYRRLGRPMMTPIQIGGQDGWRFESALPPASAEAA